MKTVTIIIALLFTIGLTSNVNSQTQIDKKSKRAIEKTAKNMAKDLQKKGWEIANSSLPMADAIAKHLMKISGGLDEKIIEVSQCVTVSLGKNQSENDAANEYLKGTASFIKGRIITELGNDAAAEILSGLDNFYGGFERILAGEMKNVMKFSLGLKKSLGNKAYAYQGWYIIDEEVAHKARLKALEQMSLESEAARKHAEKISKFVQEPFKEGNIK